MTAEDVRRLNSLVADMNEAAAEASVLPKLSFQFKGEMPPDQLLWGLRLTAVSYRRWADSLEALHDAMVEIGSRS